MAVTITTNSIDSGFKYINDADTDETVEVNVNGGPCSIGMITLDNAANGASSFFKAYDSASTVTVGTNVPDLILEVPASVARSYYFDPPLYFKNGLTYAAVTAGGTAGTTGPTSALVSQIVIQS